MTTADILKRIESEPEQLEAWAQDKMLEFSAAINSERIRLAMLIESAFHLAANLRAKRISGGGRLEGSLVTPESRCRSDKAAAVTRLLSKAAKEVV